ncbi:MAG TPA: hypothetical protein VM658_12345 [bacterium]|nr:hypothetical protein [bacterium]
MKYPVPIGGRRLRVLALLAAIILPCLFTGRDAWAKAGKDGPAALVLLWNGLKINAEYAAILAPPGSDQVLSFMGMDRAADVSALSCRGVGTCRCRGGSVVLQTPEMGGVYWLDVKLYVAPGPGLGVKAAKKSANKSITVACLVGYPSSMLRGGFLNGFELGEYPDWRDKQNPELYRPPAYFYYLDNDVLGRFISTHLRLGDLGYDGRAPLPQYFTLDYDLVRKLEVIQDELALSGLPSRFQFIGGGFISPKSNKLRTRRVSAAADLSRHMWGEAVDFIIDESPRDEIMDDMNGDGVIDVRDALVVRDIITELEQSGRVEPGGVGVYAPPRNSQIQLHVDVRGFPTRWGVKEWDPKEFAGVPPRRSLRPGG